MTARYRCGFLGQHRITLQRHLKKEQGKKETVCVSAGMIFFTERNTAANKEDAI